MSSHSMCKSEYDIYYYSTVNACILIIENTGPSNKAKQNKRQTLCSILDVIRTVNFISHNVCFYATKTKQKKAEK